ncbi:MAG: hypothetical protein U0P46_14770 [Holophagaceae bacterium]
MTRTWIALGFAVSCILPATAASYVSPARRSAPAPVAEPLGRPETLLRVEAGPASSGSQDLRPVHAPKLPSRQAPTLHKGSPEDAPGAPSGGAPGDPAPGSTPVPWNLAPAPTPAWTDHPRTFSPQGLKPEQGGQTGPPRNRVSA